MDKALTLLGLVYRANKLLLGEDALNKMKDVKLLFIACDASDKSKERYLKKCHFYNIKSIDNYSADDLASSLGKKTVKFVGITDEGFAKSLLEKI